MRIVLPALLLLPISFAIASGNRVGNGGDLVRCSHQSNILDFYESALKQKTFKGSYKEILKSVLDNLERLHPAQAKQYRNRFAEMENEIEFRSDIELTNIKDSNHVFTAKKCKLLQIAIRRNQVSNETKRFLVDKDLWETLNETNKAGLLLHEIIYEHFYKLGEEDSQKARILNAYLFSEKATTDGTDTYWQLIRSIKVPIYREASNSVPLPPESERDK